MSYLKDKKIVNLNSRDASVFNNGSYLSNLSFSFYSIVDKTDDLYYLEAGIESAQIPVSFYIINYSNNFLSYSIQNGLTITNYSITLNVGNYDYKTLFNEMKTQFLINGHTFNLSINSATGKITFTYIPIGSEYFLRINSSSTCYRIIGLVVGQTYNATANVLNCIYPLNLLGIKKLKIYVSEFLVNNLDSVRLTTTNLIQTISNDTQPWGMISYTNIDTQYSILQNKEINQLSILITDEYDNEINFNGIDWTMTFSFYLYKKNNIKDVVALSDYVNNQQINDEEPQLATQEEPQLATQEEPQLATLNATEELQNNEPIQYYDGNENVDELDFLTNF